MRVHPADPCTRLTRACACAVRRQRLFPSKAWMSVPKLKEHVGRLLRAKEEAAKAATNTASSPSPAHAASPSPKLLDGAGGNGEPDGGAGGGGGGGVPGEQGPVDAVVSPGAE